MCIFAAGPRLLSARSATRFAFQIPRAQPVSSVVARTNFRMFLPAYALSFVSPAPLSDTSRRSTISSGFYLWRHRLRIGIDSVIYSPTVLRTGRSISSKRGWPEIEFRETGFSFRIAFSFPSLSLGATCSSLLTRRKR